MKIKFSITKKLFIFTILTFAIFISGTFLVLSIFFESFDIGKHKSEMREDIQLFKSIYNNELIPYEAEKKFREETDNQEIYFSITDTSGQIKYSSDISRSLSDTGILAVLESYIDENIKSTVKQTQDPTKISEEIVEKKSLKGNKKIILGAAYLTNKNEIICAFESLGSVEEDMHAIKEFYPFFYISASLLSIFLALIFTLLVTKPLAKINNIAWKMSSLDFSERCEIRTQDEIGNLAASLNFLAENLNKALRMLKDANEKLEADVEKERNLEVMRKNFIDSISHELKTPISLISGYTNGLKDNIFENKDKDYYLDIILDEAKKMENLVLDMLDLSQLESGSFKLALEEFHLSDLILFTLNKFKLPISEKNVELNVYLKEKVIVKADWSRMEQVITNIITNAIRHVNVNGKIDVSMRGENYKILIEIENSGSSISEEELLKIWDKFYKVDKSGSKKISGNGIGLSIAKHILILHNYDFGACNTENGVKFYFIVPNKPESL